MSMKDACTTLVEYFDSKGIPTEVSINEGSGVKSVYIRDIDMTLYFTASGELMSVRAGDWPL